MQKIPDGTSGLCVLWSKKSASNDITLTQVSNAGVSGKNNEQPGTIYANIKHYIQYMRLLLYIDKFKYLHKMYT